MSSAICFNLDQSKILSSGNGLNRTFKEKKSFQEEYRLQGVSSLIVKMEK